MRTRLKWLERQLFREISILIAFKPEQQAHLFGQAQYEGARHNWYKVADLMEQCAELEQHLIDEL
jgi:hypothetical protein